MPAAKVKLTHRFESAFLFAAKIHARQKRKGTNIPYISHLMSVAALVLEAGGDEEAAIAGLLHDAVEDCGGLPMLNTIRRRFGGRVAKIVEGCTDAISRPKPPWRTRKEQYIDHLRHAPAEVRLVSAADKLHNARAILADYREIGDALWKRFHADKESQLWYYSALVAAFRQGEASRGIDRLVNELDRTVAELARLARGPKALQNSQVFPTNSS